MSQTWKEAHLSLQVCMKKEIEAMREMLANLYKEELSFLMCDAESLPSILEERAILVARLSEIRLSRIEAIKMLEQFSQCTLSEEASSLENLLPLDDENTLETLSLRDQIISLVERMNHQNARNALLCANPPASLSNRLAMSPASVAPKAKLRVTTCPKKAEFDKS